MAFATPQRHLPGSFANTPMPSSIPISFKPSSLSGARPQGRPQPRAARQAPVQLDDDEARSDPQDRSLQPITRAARTINDVLQKDALFPELDGYVKQGISSDYEIPDPNNETAWSPFQKTKVYDIPDQIFDQWNRGAVSTSMGLFAELNHAWVAIDNALYLWDYTNPNPEIIGYEEQHNNITAVRLVRPRAGVFVKTITHVLVVATTLEIILLGLESATAVSGVMKISLFSTRMSIGTKGINVKFIEGSADSGRIFFAADNGHEIYEITYQQEDKWFSSRCAKISHTADSLGYLVNMPAWFSSKSKDNIVDMVVDYSRKLLYTLSSESTIRVYYMDSPTTLQPVIEKKRHECLRDISHMTSASPLLGGSMKITSISPISAQEGSKLNLMATTSTGCRLYFSATRGYGYLSTQGAPSSMQIQHIKFPPRAIDPASSGSQAVTTTTGTDQTVDVDSQSLAYSRACHRFPPGFFLDLVSKRDRPSEDLLFLSAPDSARILAQAQGLTHQPYPRYYEVGCWIGLGGIVEAVGLVTPPFAASRQPIGFGNELAVQYDEPATEIAILTNTGVHIIKRRRLVDIFASALRTGGNDEGFDTEIKKFIRQYGRGETNATALAVACGQGNDASLTSSPDLRVARINDPQTLELARKCFVEHGGRPTVNDSAGAETMAQAVDSVRPSSRHEGLALYMGRLVRSLWKTPVITQKAATPGSSFTLSTTIPITKLQSVQDDLMKLKAFLDQNKSFIEGLSGPEGLHRANNPAEDIALQGEHQALYSLQRLNLSIIEGISFVQMLFDERVDEIWTTLDGSTKQRFCDLTYELLFSTDQGKDLAKVLVKAIVNRNIANGSNVDTVAEALRRRCGSFCSADDVIIFKAQELLKKASEVGPNTDLGRNHLNESLRLFQQVAGALSFDNLQTAAENFTGLNFYAGAIALVLNVANQHDRGNQAGAWEAEQKPMNDPREALYAFRKQCYDLVHEILLVVDEETAQQPEYVDGKMTKSAQKRLEAYDEVNSSEDELFLFDLYDWYLEKKWVDKLISIKSKHVVAFLTRESRKNSGAADLLWRYWVHHQEFYNAAVIQHELAQQTEFDLPLSRRIELLSRAKANANTQSGSLGRQQRQVLLHSVSELLEVANIQDEILHRLKGDLRIPEERKQLAVAQLNNQILPVNVLYNEYADQAEYYDICLLVFECANHRNDADIVATWQYYIQQTHDKIANDPQQSAYQPFEAIIGIMREMSQRLKNSEATFNPAMLIPLIESYALESQRNVGPPTWVVDLFISVNYPFESILTTLHGLFMNQVAPFTGSGRTVIAEHILYVAEKWYSDCIRSNTRPFATEENAQVIHEILHSLRQGVLRQSDADRAGRLARQLEETYQ